MAERILVYRDNGKTVTLTPADHLATGGEGAVYLQNDTVFKVYLEPVKARAAGMEQKIAALAAIRHPGIAAPTGALRNKHGELVGLTFNRAKGEALCRCFTNSWRDSHQFGDVEAAKVVEAMRNITETAHAHRALMVDANEMNWLVAGVSPTAIDVDSWQLPGFPATAIMPSIRDYNATRFSEETDWFAWAVVTFQLWTGIHPYKGTHPDFGRAALQERMQARASIFDPRVKLPAAARSVQDIPLNLRQWYEGIFSTADRSAPPSLLSSSVAAQRTPRMRVMQSPTGSLKQERLGLAGEKAVRALNGFVVARQSQQLVLWDALARARVPHAVEEELKALLQGTAVLLRTPQNRLIVSLLPASGELVARDLDSGDLTTLASRATRLWQSGNRAFALVENAANGLHELDVRQLAGKLLLTVRQQWPLSTLSTSFFRHCFVQDCLGAFFVGVVDRTGVLQASAPDLKHYRVVDALAVDKDNVWLVAIRRSSGELVRLCLSHAVDRFVVTAEDVMYLPTLEGAVAPNGVGLLVFGDDVLIVKGAQRKRLADVALPDEMRLFSLPDGIGGVLDGEVVKLSFS